jgi:hypothetical protein
MVLLALLVPATSALAAVGDGNAAFDRVWATTDQAVASGQASYSWFWGPTVNDQTYESYAESPEQQREVRYYDKSRMEIHNPSGDQNNIYYVTNGLLTTELVTGQMQMGDNEFEPHVASSQLVAGDATNNPGTPSYAAFAPYATTDGATKRADDRTGQPVTEYLNGAGELSSTTDEGVHLASYQGDTGHNIPDVFWTWENNPANGFRPDQGVNWLYVLGFPITEPYWIDSTVGGTPHRVLVQLYQRRVLTYTPSNPAQYQIEFGNIGQHYHAWRYDNVAPGDVPTDGATLYQSDLSDWPAETIDIGASFIENGTFHMRNDSPGQEYLWYLTGDVGGPADYGASSASVDVRMVSDSNESYGCLMAHVTSDPATSDLTEEYAFCADGYDSASNGGYGTVSVAHEWWDDTGHYQFESPFPLDYTTPPALHTKNEWNTLKLVIKGNQLWFLVNGELVGSATSLGPASGDVGLLVFNADPQPAEFEFRNLVVKAVQ